MHAHRPFSLSVFIFLSPAPTPLTLMHRLGSNHNNKITRRFDPTQLKKTQQSQHPPQKKTGARPAQAPLRPPGAPGGRGVWCQAHAVGPKRRGRRGLRPQAGAGRAGLQRPHDGLCHGALAALFGAGGGVLCWVTGCVMVRACMRLVLVVAVFVG